MNTRSELLSCCFVEADEVATAHERRMRRKTLLASLLLEAALLAALALLPLFASSARPSLLRVTPLPPYYGSSRAIRDASPPFRLRRMCVPGSVRACKRRCFCIVSSRFIRRSPYKLTWKAQCGSALSSAEMAQ